MVTNVWWAAQPKSDSRYLKGWICDLHRDGSLLPSPSSARPAIPDSHRLHLVAEICGLHERLDLRTRLSRKCLGHCSKSVHQSRRDDPVLTQHAHIAFVIRVASCMIIRSI